MTPEPKARAQAPTVQKEPRSGSLRARVLLAIRRACAEQRAVAYADLARASGTSAAAVRTTCQDLCRRGLIAIERRRGLPGRPDRRGHPVRESELRFLDGRSGTATAWTGGGWGGIRGGYEPGRLGIRTCLTCGEKFRSSGIRNRMCKACLVETADYDVSSHRYYGREKL